MKLNKFATWPGRGDPARRHGTCQSPTATASSSVVQSIEPAPMHRGVFPGQMDFPITVSLLNERDGGINGVPLMYEECDTAYNTDKGVECYERMKNNGPTGMPAVMPLSTGVTYALLDRVVADKIPSDYFGLRTGGCC